MMPTMAKKSNESYQGNYIWKVILDLKIPSNPTREEFKAVYDASKGNVLNFRSSIFPEEHFSQSWDSE